MVKVTPGKPAFVEPEETIELNNDVFSLEHEESREVYRILRELTATSRLMHAPLLETYHEILGEFDFIRARQNLPEPSMANCPLIIDKAHVHLDQGISPFALSV